MLNLPPSTSLCHTEPVGGAPTCSVVAQEVVVNAVENELIARKHFTEKDFKFNHPGGSLGKSLQA